MNNVVTELNNEQIDVLLDEFLKREEQVKNDTVAISRGLVTISSMSNEEMCDLIEEALDNGCKADPNDTDPKNGRKCSEVWLRGWCSGRTTKEFEEYAVKCLHNYYIF